MDLTSEHLLTWVLGIIIALNCAIGGAFYRHTVACTDRVLRTNETLDKLHDGITVGAQIALSEVRTKAMEAMSIAAMEAQRVRLELSEYKTLAKDEFASSEQLMAVEGRINAHLDTIERKFDEFAKVVRRMDEGRA